MGLGKKGEFMKSRSLAPFLFFLLLLTAPSFANAPRGGYPALEVSYKQEVHAEGFDDTYQNLLSEMIIVSKKLPPFLKKEKLSRTGKRQYLRKEVANLRKRYLELDHKIAIYKPVFDLKESLKTMYLKGATQSVDENVLNEESLRLSIGLMDEIGRLKQKYKSFSIPIVHNMLIDVGIKKRGACKHWAEDLLDYMRPISRQFFSITWGEANPKKFNEHNVAVIYPNYSEFADGLIIDPWRTSGKPYWITVKDDHHYKWQKWALYSVY